MTANPVTFALEQPARMSRAHVFLRIVILILASWIAGSGSGLGLVYLGLPGAAAILISQKGGSRYIDEDGERVTGWVTFIVGVLAYVALLTDQLPGGGRKPVRLEIVRSGSPTVGSALLRIVKAIPSALLLALIGIVGSIVSLIAAISILLNERYPETLWNFQAGIVRWQARLLAYLASLLEVYPPFSFDTGPSEPSTTTAPPAYAEPTTLI
jgi:Domain of unknown function (DUF4389)